MLDYFLAIFAGFTIGRIGHIVGGQIMWIPHHWIIGLVIIFIGLICVFIKKIRYLGIIIILIGLGIFISDFDDFLAIKVWQPPTQPY